MKWLLFAVSLLGLWIAFNSLFMLPGQYSAINFVLAGIGIVVGVLLAWISGRHFVGTELKISTIMKAPPMVLCVFILLIFCAIGIMKFIAYR
jgi:hypothetical protein